MKRILAFLTCICGGCVYVATPDNDKIVQADSDVTIRLDTFVLTDIEFGYTIFVEEEGKILFERNIYYPPCPNDMNEQVSSKVKTLDL